MGWVCTATMSMRCCEAARCDRALHTALGSSPLGRPPLRSCMLSSLACQTIAHSLLPTATAPPANRHPGRYYGRLVGHATRCIIATGSRSSSSRHSLFALCEPCERRHRTGGSSSVGPAAASGRRGAVPRRLPLRRSSLRRVRGRWSRRPPRARLQLQHVHQEGIPPPRCLAAAVCATKRTG